MHLRRFCTLLGIAVLAIATTADAAVHQVNPGESIQAKIDIAAPGDTILVEPGVYQETQTPANADYGLRISTDNLRLIGKVKPHLGEAGKVRLIQNDAQETGIYAAPPGPDCEYDDSEGTCPDVLQGFYVRGFTVEEFPENGIQTRWVDGFKFIRNESKNNLNNGIYPTLSANGLVRNNVSYGSLDTAMWVAGSENVRVIGNEVYESTIGFEITVSNNVWAVNNDIHNNTVGVGLFHPNAAGNPTKPVMEDWVIAFNDIYDNNLPNPAPITSFQGGLPPGIGVLLLGVSDHTIAVNKVEGNDFVGIGVLGWCTATSLGDPSRNCINDPPVTASPSANNNLVFGNLLANGSPDPSPVPPLPRVDILYVQTPAAGEPGTGNCFRNNRPADFSFLSSTGDLPTDGC
jgi:parallel beta-helix repeat protein